jgi:cell division protein FtsW (lipid II flippase)/cell division protein FtsI/penicillin-binding protein 2
MRIVAEAADAAIPSRWQHGPVRGARIELLGLLACSIVVVTGVWLTCWGRTARLFEDAPPGAILQLNQIKQPADLEPLLAAYEQPAERQAVARALFARVLAADRSLDHVGGLAAAAIPAAEVQKDPRLVELRARLARRPDLANVPALTPATLASIKPRLAVRSALDFRRRIVAAVLCLLAAFWAAHGVRRWRRADDDPLVLPVLLLLCGLGFTSMIALRDPLRDTMIGWGFMSGVVAGVAVLMAAAEIDFEASPLRRAVIAPLALALVLAALLLLFGSGPGTSGAKVNLLGVQPVEAIRLLIVMALAAYFARRLDFLRELSEPVTPARPWMRWLHLPRWKDLRPILVSMAVVLAFFFLQKDLGPALVMSCVFLGLFGIARGRVPLVVLGFGLLVCGFAVAYAIGFPATVRQRVTIWTDPWSNGVSGGNQIAHGLWALSTGGSWGLGQGLGSPQAIPAGHTDFVLAAVGEELGFAGIAIVAALYVLLCWRCLRIAIRAPGDYTAFLAVGLTLALVVQTLLISGGLLGLVPLAGVVTPFLSFGKSSMLSNFAAMGIVLAIGRRRSAVRPQISRAVYTVGGVLLVAGAAVAARAWWVQMPRADAYAVRASLGRQADGGYRFEYNPRLLTAARQIPRGSIYDRHGLAIATSRPDEMGAIGEAYKKAAIEPRETCGPDILRCYPLGGAGFHVTGDWRYQTNWGARNSSYLERDRAATLQGFDDRPTTEDVINPLTGAAERAVRRDYRELLPLARNRYRPRDATVRALLSRKRDVQTTLDAGLQLRTAAALRRGIQSSGTSRGSAVVLDVATGEVLASASYPWPEGDDLKQEMDGPEEESSERFLDRARYGLYPPGSVFKLLVAGAALRSHVDTTFTCVRLPDGRVGNYVPGSRRPVRDDPLDTVPHGVVDMRSGLVASCNAYFAQLAVRLGPRPLLETSALFQIDLARVPTASGLQGSLAHAGYGQGEVLVSPLRMARVAASIARGGLVSQVRWDREAGQAEPPARFLGAAEAALLGRYMREVVTAGTGRVLHGSRIPIAGKTGTAEVGRGRAHSWFVGFAPYGAGRPRIAFAVIVENAGYGARTAAPIAGEVVMAAEASGLFRREEKSR